MLKLHLSGIFSYFKTVTKKNKQFQKRSKQIIIFEYDVTGKIF